MLITLPCYVIQTNILTNSICSEIDKIARQFLWGSFEEGKKVHLVSWYTVCQSKNEGGLGINFAALINQAYLVKIGWHLISQSESLCDRVFQFKYLKGGYFLSAASTSSNLSPVWKGVLAIKSCFYLKWDGLLVMAGILGFGRIIGLIFMRLWRISLFGLFLIFFILKPLRIKMRVALRMLLILWVIFLLISPLEFKPCFLLLHWLLMINLFWKLSSNGLFSLRSTVEVLHNDSEVVEPLSNNVDSC